LKNQGILIDFILNEWLVIASGISLALTSVYTKHIPVYSLQELQVLFILFILFVAAKGLQQSSFLAKLSQNIETGKLVPLKLVVTTFFLSMVVTNDIALIVIVPLTLLLDVDRKDILVILEALSANAGSALTPFGNPQNLFIYWFYDLHPITFISTIAPFSLAFMAILAVSACLVKTRTNAQVVSATRVARKTASIYGILLVIVLLIVLRVLPVSAGLIVIVLTLFVDRKIFRVDYPLLFSFFFFFGLADNVKILLVSELNHSEHVFLLSALVSQIMSNVPATLLFAKFTSNWEALLWGANAGGFGSLFGSFANLIAYKIYVTHESTNHTAMFMVKFLIIGYTAFFMSIGLYFLLHRFQ